MDFFIPILENLFFIDFYSQFSVDFSELIIPSRFFDFEFLLIFFFEKRKLNNQLID